MTEKQSKVAKVTAVNGAIGVGAGVTLVTLLRGIGLSPWEPEYDVEIGVAVSIIIGGISTLIGVWVKIRSEVP